MTCLACLPSPDTAHVSGCACDHTPFPPCDSIPPGLPALPAQPLGFPQFREHLLSSAALRPELYGWAARAEQDLGVMLLESWAYVLDVLEFYDRRIAEESYIATARDPVSLRRLAGLVGYQPRPAVAASATVAALAEGPDCITVKKGSQLRSKPLTSVPAQVFEIDADAVIDPRANAWQLAALRDENFAGIFAFEPRETAVAPGQMVAITIDGSVAAAAIVQSVKSTRMADGVEYRLVGLDPLPALIGPPVLSSIQLHAMSQNAAPSPFPLSSSNAVQSGSAADWALDSLYPQILGGDVVVVETDTGLVPAVVDHVGTADIILGVANGNNIIGKATMVSFASAVQLKRLHFRAIVAGKLTNPAMTDVPVATLLGPNGAQGTYLAPACAEPVAFVVAGQGKAGVELAGSVTLDGQGTATLAGDRIVGGSAASLQTPVVYYGNLLTLTRGETVANEVLGSGDSSQAWQKFRLKKKPLTYLPDPGTPGAVAPQLEVRVNGILWHRVDSFVTAPKGERVYVLRHDDGSETDVLFGDLVRPETGADNITATYRFGAGEAAPLPGELTQIVGKVEGLSQIVAPLSAGGGADAEQPSAIRLNAPRSVMTYGRAVSIDDYAAIAAAFPGVIASSVAWAWVTGAQLAGVSAYVIANGDSVAESLRTALVNAGDPLIPVDVTQAVPESHMLAVAIVLADDYASSDVALAVANALQDPQTGLLAPANAAIGGALFRSWIAAAVAAVPGVAAVEDIVVDGDEMPNAMAAPQGAYLAFTLRVGAGP